ncbi:MAG: FtsB family cell division protein [Propioniciclava sp.]
MASRDRRQNRQPAGPTRTTRRTPSQGPTSASTMARATAPVGRALTRAARRIPRPRRGFVVTQRFLVFGGVLVLLALSFATSLRVYIVQSGDLALARQQIEERTARAAALQDELDRWSDDAYVRAQARNRLGWVLPGEVGYRVVGRDGEVLDGTDEIQGIGTDSAGATEAWWERLAGSLSAADQPEAARP